MYKLVGGISITILTTSPHNPGLGDEGAVMPGQARDGVYFCRFDGLFQAHGRQDRRQAHCQHTFARPRRADKQNVIYSLTFSL